MINNLTDIAWAAGLFDGEGHVGLRWPKRKQAFLELKMIHKPTVEKFANIVGGKVTCGYEHRRGRRTQWNCRLYDNAAIRVGTLLLPYLCEKAEQVKAMLMFKRAHTDNERQVYADMLRAAKRQEYKE